MLLGSLCNEFLYLANCLARIKVLGTGVGAIHYGVATVEFEGIFKLIESFARRLVAAVNDPSVGLQ